MTETLTTDTPEAIAAAPVAEQPTVTYENYWGTDETVNWYLPDGKQYMTIKPMNEGAKAKFQKMTSRDFVMSQKRDGEARVAVDPAGDRHQLIKASVVGWNLMQPDPKAEGGWSPAPFSQRTLDAWLEVAPPHIVERLEHAIRLANPWMQSEMTVEMIDEEIERLYDLRRSIIKETEGEDVSANK